MKRMTSGGVVRSFLDGTGIAALAAENQEHPAWIESVLRRELERRAISKRTRATR